MLLPRLNASNPNASLKRSRIGKVFASRASTPKIWSTFKPPTGRNGTRFHPPLPLKVLPARVMPGKIAPAPVETELSLAVTGWAEASVVMAESCHPFTTYLPKALSLLMNFGSHIQLMDARCLWSRVELPLSNPQLPGTVALLKVFEMFQEAPCSLPSSIACDQV